MESEVSSIVDVVLSLCLHTRILKMQLQRDPEYFTEWEQVLLPSSSRDILRISLSNMMVLNRSQRVSQSRNGRHPKVVSKEDMLEIYNQYFSAVFAIQGFLWDKVLTLRQSHKNRVLQGKCTLPQIPQSLPCCASKMWLMNLIHFPTFPQAQLGSSLKCCFPSGNSTVLTPQEFNAPDTRVSSV